MVYRLCSAYRQYMKFSLRAFLFCAVTTFLTSSGLSKPNIRKSSIGFSQPPLFSFGTFKQNDCLRHTVPASSRSCARKVNLNSVSRTLAILSMGGKGDSLGSQHDGFDFIPRRGELSDATITHFEFVAECELPTERQGPSAAPAFLYLAVAPGRVLCPFRLSPRRTTSLRATMSRAGATSACARTGSRAPRW